MQRIFKRYLEIQSPTTIVRELEADGIVGTCGNPMDKAYINRILNNRLYIGEVEYEGAVYPGEHEAIIDRRTWDLAHQFLRAKDPWPVRTKSATAPAALSGLIRCGHCHCAMTPVKSRRRGREYHYYHCSRNMKKLTECPIKQVSAGEIEAIVLGNLKPVVQAPEVVAKVAEQTGLNPNDVLSMFKGDFWRELLPEEKKRLMQILVKHVTIGEDGIEMEFHTESIKSIQEAYHAQSS